jgi:hypothetical protein
MNDRVSEMSETIIPFPNGSDPLDSTGQAVLGMVRRAADVAEDNNQHALGIAHKLALQVRVAEDRIKELEADIRHYKGRADRAEKWLHQISLEIEQKFFASTDSRLLQAPTGQTNPRDYARKR